MFTADERIADVLVRYRRGQLDLAEAISQIKRVADLNAAGDPVDEQPSEPEPRRTAAKRSAKLTPEIARKWADGNGEPGSRPEPSVVIKHFKTQGFEVPSVRTVRRWFEPKRQTD